MHRKSLTACHKIWTQLISVSDRIPTWFWSISVFGYEYLPHSIAFNILSICFQILGVRQRAPLHAAAPVWDTLENQAHPPPHWAPDIKPGQSRGIGGHRLLEVPDWGDNQQKKAALSPLVITKDMSSLTNTNLSMTSEKEAMALWGEQVIYQVMPQNIDQ